VTPTLGASVVLLVVAAAAVASVETRTVGSFWQGMWWAVSLMTTVGFIGEPPETAPGAVLSVALMLTGFGLLALVSAALASLFVEEDVEPLDTRERAAEQEVLSRLTALAEQVAALEARLAADDRGGPGSREGGPGH
jgi:hypothetical protein